jgi:hypothetical protein
LLLTASPAMSIPDGAMQKESVRTASPVVQRFSQL